MTEIVGYESNPDTRIRSRSRRRRRAIVLLAMAVIATALFFAWRSLPVLVRDGAVWARIEITVRDAATGRPVPGAAVTVLDRSGAALPLNVSLATPTDSAGHATARVWAGMGRADHFVYENIDFGTNGETVQIIAPGYAPVTVDLPPGDSTWRLPGGRINAVLRARVDLTPSGPRHLAYRRPVHK